MNEQTNKWMRYQTNEWVSNEWTGECHIKWSNKWRKGWKDRLLMDEEVVGFTLNNANKCQSRHEKISWRNK